MKKIGILTFHYSNNYGGVLQAVALQNVIESFGYNTEIINYIPAAYKPVNYMSFLTLLKRDLKKMMKGRFDLSLFSVVSKKKTPSKYQMNNIVSRFDAYRTTEMKLSKAVDEHSLPLILNDYAAVIVGSDQIWNPSQRAKPEYFLNYGDEFCGIRMSYAADSTTADVDAAITKKLKTALDRFDYISVRNDHSFEFVKKVTGKETDIVADPTILFDYEYEVPETVEEYILAYIIGKQIRGGHSKVIEKIKEKNGNLPVFLIKIPEIGTESPDFADKILYDAGPSEWLNLFGNAKFIYTDSYHGVLFALKFHKPFLAYYNDELRSTRMLDMSKRYHLDSYIINSVDEIESKGSVETVPAFKQTDVILNEQKNNSINILQAMLKRYL